MQESHSNGSDNPQHCATTIDLLPGGQGFLVDGQPVYVSSTVDYIADWLEEDSVLIVCGNSHPSDYYSKLASWLGELKVQPKLVSVSEFNDQYSQSVHTFNDVFVFPDLRRDEDEEATYDFTARAVTIVRAAWKCCQPSNAVNVYPHVFVCLPVVADDLSYFWAATGVSDISAEVHISSTLAGLLQQYLDEVEARIRN